LIADKTIFVSNTQKKYYSSKYIIKQKKIQVIYNGIDLRRFSLKYNFTLRKSLNIGHDAFLMGMVGNFSPGRDHLTICKFLLLLHKLEFNFEFLFIGGKNLSYPDLYVNCVSFCEKNGINDKIHFLGIRKDVPELLSQLDLFIFSTNHDAFGNSVLEAMASGFQ
jgi:glycosyltransferase involved in cell wall biosynthesis